MIQQHFYNFFLQNQDFLQITQTSQEGLVKRRSPKSTNDGFVRRTPTVETANVRNRIFIIVIYNLFVLSRQQICVLEFYFQLCPGKSYILFSSQNAQSLCCVYVIHWQEKSSQSHPILPILRREERVKSEKDGRGRNPDRHGRIGLGKKITVFIKATRKKNIMGSNSPDTSQP